MTVNLRNIGPVPHDISYYSKCMLGGALACGLTHAGITPLDVAKCNMQVMQFYPLLVLDSSTSLPGRPCEIQGTWFHYQNSRRGRGCQRYLERVWAHFGWLQPPRNVQVWSLRSLQGYIYEPCWRRALE